MPFIQAEKLPTPKNPNTKEFKGSGTTHLHVPGLLKLESVQIGLKEATPQEVVHKVPVRKTNDDGDEWEKVVHPLFSLEIVKGEPYLLRNVVSNFGIWQVCETFYVTGEWSKEDAKADDEKPEAKPAVKK
jgi:hypothetical protein